MGETRILPPTDVLFRNLADVPTETLTRVEGAAVVPGAVGLHVMMVTEDLEFLRVSRKKGTKDPVHRHDDHGTVAFLVSGRAKVTIGEETFLAEPGAVWHHPRGVPHTTEALEDMVQIEVKCPAVKTW